MVQGCFGFRQVTRGTAGKELTHSQGSPTRPVDGAGSCGALGLSEIQARPYARSDFPVLYTHLRSIEVALPRGAGELHDSSQRAGGQLEMLQPQLDAATKKLAQVEKGPEGPLAPCQEGAANNVGYKLVTESKNIQLEQ